MRTGTDKAAAWVYEGLWGVLVKWCRVPAQPPTLPSRDGEGVLQFRPAPGFLQYLKLAFWVSLVVINTFILAVTIAIIAAEPLLGCVLVGPMIILATVPHVLGYVALHLRYDTTWYVLCDRSLRIRRGVWILKEVTITFENVQNLSVRRGPLQRYFGIADLIVETAGGGGGGKQKTQPVGHQAIIEGIDNAPELRDRILREMRRSSGAGLGDEDADLDVRAGVPAWPPQHLHTLREIRDEVRAMAQGAW